VAPYPRVRLWHSFISAWVFALLPQITYALESRANAAHALIPTKSNIGRLLMRFTPEPEMRTSPFEVATCAVVF
jgi:hypothetical protein